MLNVERYTQNLAVIASFKNNQACSDLLKRYSGWGGLREAIYTPEIYKELKKSLSLEEIACLKKTMTSAYYTPPELVTFIYGWLQAYGFTGGDILEPAIGHGVFVEHMPQEMRDNSTLTGIEIDSVSSQIVKKLYPDVRVFRQGFETFHPEKKFDLVIGNPPYGSQKIVDEQHKDLKDFCIHHYFVAKGMRLLKEGGILAMVLPSFFLDNIKDHVRHIIDKEGGSLLAAYRLPDDLFSDAKVTVDIVFLKKGKTGEKWLFTRDITIGDMTKPMNDYFNHHSQNILGNLEIINMYKRKGLTCKRRGDPFKLLQNVLTSLRQVKLVQMMQELKEIEQQEKTLQVARDNLMARCQPLLFLQGR